jgi:hypothetical protein
MHQKDPWDLFSNLGESEQAELIHKVAGKAHPTGAGSGRISDDELRVYSDLLEVLNREHQRKKLANILREFLPKQ